MFEPASTGFTYDKKSGDLKSVQVTRPHQVLQLDQLCNIQRDEVMSPQDVATAKVIDAFVMLARHDDQATVIHEDDIYNEVTDSHTRPVTPEENDLLHDAWLRVANCI